jgi:hypothetical protein
MTFFSHLAEDLEPRLFFRERSLEARNFLFRIRDARLDLAQSLFGRAQIFFPLLRRLPLCLHRSARRREIRLCVLNIAGRFTDQRR